MRNLITASLLSAFALLSPAGEALSHELFVRLDNHHLQPHSKATLKLLNGTFEKSEGPVGRSRMSDVSILGGSERSRPDPNGWSDVGKQSQLTFLTADSATYIAGVSTQYAESERSADEFATYLKLEGIPDLLAKYDKSAHPKGVRYRYAKHARTIFQVGNTPDTGHSALLNYPTEIMLMSNPSQLKAGDTVKFQALYQGGPLAQQLVHVGHSSAPASQELRTDQNGMGKFAITAPAIWYIHFNRMEKSQTPGFDFESDRASLTFEVK